MAELTPASEAIAALLSEGWTYASIGKALGVNGSLVRQAIAPSPKQRQKPLVKYVPALRDLSIKSKKPGEKPAALPGKRVTKTGKTASVRKGTKTITTKKGVQHTVTSVKKAPATLKKAIKGAATRGKRLRWDIHVKKLKVYPDRKAEPGWISGHLPSGWDAQKLSDRINTPEPENGDTWKAGDVNAALLSIALEQNQKVLNATGSDEFNLFTAD